MSGRMSKITTVAELNEALTDCFKDIIGVGASSKSDHFDETVRDKLKQHLVGAKYVPCESWSSKDKHSIYYERSRRTLKKNFDFTDLPVLVDNFKEHNLLIVDKPNGSQQWPDLMVVFNNVGYPIEVKSTKTDIILWNSGLPRHDSLYVYNCYGKSKTTVFQGQDAITQEEIDILLEFSARTKIFNTRGNRWSYYVRDMFGSSQKFFEVEKDQKTYEKIGNQINELRESILNSPDTITAFKLKTIKAKISELDDKYYEIHRKFNRAKQKREEIEKRVFSSISLLTWDNNQKTDFNLGSLEDSDDKLDPVTEAEDD